MHLRVAAAPVVVVMVVVAATAAGVAVAPQEANLDVLLLDQRAHTVLQLPRQRQPALRAPLDDGQAQVAELVLALHVVLAVQARVLQAVQQTRTDVMCDYHSSILPILCMHATM